MSEQNEPTKIFGLIAEFDQSSDLLAAAAKARDAGFVNMDAYVPFPVHGLDEALGIKRSRLPWIVLAGAIAGGLGGFFLQYWVSVIEYPLNIGGRPFFSWPSFIVITFECTILGAGLTIITAMLGLNGLPRPHHPIFNAPNFERASQDGFFLCIESEDPRFDLAETRSFLASCSPKAVSEVPE